MANITVKKNTLKFVLALGRFNAQTGEIYAIDEERTLSVELPSNYTPSASTVTLQSAFINDYMTNYANKQGQSDDGSQQAYIGSLIQRTNWRDADDSDESYPLDVLACASIQSALVQETTTYFDNND